MSKENILLLISIPLYFAAGIFEYVKAYRKRNKSYDWKDTLISLWFGIAGASIDLLMKGFCFLVLGAISVYSPIRLAAFDTNPLLSWTIVFIAQDLCFYWLHRTEHQSRLFWAVHSNHHSSEHYNFAVALRSSVLQPTYRFIFYIPVALLGFDGITIMFMYAINQFYQFWLHTETIGRLPRWFEYIFVTPSHHRVHHASNIKYLDRNMGQVLIIWDRMFGTFQEELPEEKPRFGLTKPLETYHPVKSVFYEFEKLAADVKKDTSFRTKLAYIFNAPGWSHDGSSKTADEMREGEERSQEIEAGG